MHVNMVCMYVKLFVKVQHDNVDKEGISWWFSADGITENILECNHTVSNCNDGVLLGEENTLTLVDPDLSSSGIYICKATSLAGKVTTSNITYLPPTIAFPSLQHRYYNEGEDVSFYCTFEVSLLQ